MLFEAAYIVLHDSVTGGSHPGADSDPSAEYILSKIQSTRDAEQDSENKNDGRLRFAQWIIFFQFLLIANIVAFNSLIAIIADTFDKIQSESAYYDAVQKFALLNELNNIYMFKNRIYATEEPEKVFIHIIKYADNETAEKDW